MSDPENALARYFRDSGDSLSSLAARMGRSPSTLTRAVNGERNPSVSLAREVEQHTGGKVAATEFIDICIRAADPTHAERGAA